MYMDSDLNLDFKNDFVLMTDNNGNLTCGGFTINSDLLSLSLDQPNVQLGGKKDVLKDLKDLGLPAGLIYKPSTSNRNTLIKYNHESELCSDSLYDKLLDLVNIEDKKKFAIKTKKKRENRKKMSRRSKK
jgi:hypothetical protein|uniref:Uncharacterized protein n=1 Tax=viral metagenome TaxID=1070528 RepID=A0A6C0CXP0_9ZZZZ